MIAYNSFKFIHLLISNVEWLLIGTSWWVFDFIKILNYLLRCSGESRKVSKRLSIVISSVTLFVCVIYKYLGFCVDLINGFSGYIGFTVDVQVEIVVVMKCCMVCEMHFL